MSPRPGEPAGAQHLGALVSAYVDRRLPPPLQRACDRHLVACAVCREAAAAERRLLGSLRAAPMPGPPGNLQASLLGLAAQAQADASVRLPQTPTPLGVVSPHAPALHRSPVRAALLAGLAAGASAAAAWSIGVAAPAAPASGSAHPVTPNGSSTAARAGGSTGVFARTVSAVRAAPSSAPSTPDAPTSMTSRHAHWAESRHD